MAKLRFYIDANGMRDIPYDDVMIERFREDPAYAATLLNSIFEDGDDQGELQVLLPLMLTAFSDRLDESQAIQDINRLTGMLRTMGLRLFVEPSSAPRQAMAHA